MEKFQKWQEIMIGRDYKQDMDTLFLALWVANVVINKLPEGLLMALKKVAKEAGEVAETTSSGENSLEILSNINKQQEVVEWARQTAVLFKSSIKEEDKEEKYDA